MPTYNYLKSQVTRWMQRSTQDTITIQSIPDFVALAQDRICSDYENTGFKQVIVSVQPLGGFQNGIYTYTKPARWRRTLNINYGIGVNNNQRVILTLRDYGVLIDYWPDRTVTGKPLYYADYDFSHWIVAPTPDAYYPFEVVYIEKPQPLSDQSQTNWLTEYAYSLLFYATLLESLPFLKNYPYVDVIENQYAVRLASLKKQDKQRIEDASSNRESV